jgi:uncharacterized protein (DUF952 family)
VSLTIDASRLQADVRGETLGGANQRFPHIYGPRPIDAVVLARPVPVSGDSKLSVDQLMEPEN